MSRNLDSKHWVVQLQAGGSCGTYDSCLDRSKGSLGSSRNYSDFLTGTFVASDDPAENPMFSSWNKVFVPYCRYFHIIKLEKCMYGRRFIEVLNRPFPSYPLPHAGHFGKQRLKLRSSFK